MLAITQHLLRDSLALIHTLFVCSYAPTGTPVADDASAPVNPSLSEKDKSGAWEIGLMDCHILNHFCPELGPKGHAASKDLHECKKRPTESQRSDICGQLKHDICSRHDVVRKWLAPVCNDADPAGICPK